MKKNNFLCFLFTIITIYSAMAHDETDRKMDSQSSQASFLPSIVDEIARLDQGSDVRQHGKTVLTFGTFDLFHIGHLNILQRAREYGSKLIVGVSTDEFSFRRKGKMPVYPQEHRLRMIESLKYVDECFYESDYNQKPAFIDQYKADIMILGDDWAGKFDTIHPTCQMIYLPRTPDISTTEIVAKIATGNTKTEIEEKEIAVQQEFVTDDAGPERALGFYQLMKDIDDAFTVSGAIYVATQGTLLGSVRHEGYIPWDIDIDIAIFDGNIKGIDRALSILQSLNCLVQYEEDAVSIRRGQFLAGITVFRKNFSFYSVLENETFPIQRKKFGGLMINAPNRFEETLTRLYGESWNKVVRKYSWSAASFHRLESQEPCHDSSKLPLGPFGPLQESVSAVRCIDQKMGSGLDGIINFFPEETASHISFAGDIVLRDGFALLDYGTKARWLTGGRTAFTIFPNAIYHFLLIDLPGHLYKETNASEVILKGENDITERLIYDPIRSKIFFMRAIVKPENFSLTMPFGNPSEDNSQFDDHRNLHYYLESVDIKGINSIESGATDIFTAGNLSRFFVDGIGFYNRESTGTWSSDQAEILFGSNEAKPYKMEILFHAFMPFSGGDLGLSIFDGLGGELFSFKATNELFCIAHFTYPAVMGVNKLKFVVDGADSPKRLGMSDDERVLGIKLKGIKVL